MKKLLIILSTCALTLNAISQNIIIKDYNGFDYTNSTRIHTGTTGAQEVSFHVEMDAMVKGDKYIAMKRYENKVCPGTQNYFCWTLCYGALDAGVKPLWEDREIKIEEDSVFEEFHAYYDDKGMDVDAEFLYVLYDTSNVNDSSWVLIKFDYSNNNCVDGINDFNNVNNISIFPNPANDFFVVSNSKQGDVIEVLDILGKTIYSTTNHSDFHRLNSYKNGIYLVRIKRDDEVIFTEKLIIK